MRTISATEASRRFSDLLDAIERGETVTVTRGSRPSPRFGRPVGEPAETFVPHCPRSHRPMTSSSTTSPKP